MTQLQKYTWLIETIRRAGKISHKELSDRWERNKDLSDCRPLHRATFNRWRDAIFDQFGIMIDCQKTGGYLYYISNPEEIDEYRLKKWMLDTFAVGDMIRENLSLRDRILIAEIPSGRGHLNVILTAIKENRVLSITYRPFRKQHSYTFPIEPYCVKLFENRWYVLAHNVRYGDMRVYSLDRVEKVEPTDEHFRLPKDFVAEAYFSPAFGIVIGTGEQPEKIVIRAKKDHKYYIRSLPLHHSQKETSDRGEYADFELFLSPTYDFVMKLLQVGAWVEVIEPLHLRKTMKAWIKDMYDAYDKIEYI